MIILTHSITVSRHAEGRAHALQSSVETETKHKSFKLMDVSSQLIYSLRITAKLHSYPTPSITQTTRMWWWTIPHLEIYTLWLFSSFFPSGDSDSFKFFLCWMHGSNHFSAMVQYFFDKSKCYIFIQSMGTEQKGIYCQCRDYSEIWILLLIKDREMLLYLNKYDALLPGFANCII